MSTSFKTQCDNATKLAKDVEPAPLPSVNHLTYKDYDNVYEPSDDTFLLIDAIHHDVPIALGSRSSSGGAIRSVELGSGSGVNVVAMARAVQGAGWKEGMFYATDINEVAAKTTEGTIAANGPWDDGFEFGVHVVDLLGEVRLL